VGVRENRGDEEEGGHEGATFCMRAVSDKRDGEEGEGGHGYRV